MKTRLGKLIGTVILAGAIVLSLNIPAAKASGDCPAGHLVFCGSCSLSYALVWYESGVVITECHYDCWCGGGGGGGEPMYIEQTVYMYD